MPPETPAQEPNPPSPFASTPIATEVLAKLAQGLGVRKPLLLITGESGMGKTPLVRKAIERFGERATIAWMLEPQLDAKELLPKLLELFGGTARPGTSPLAHAERLLMTLANATAAGRIAVLVVDDAHKLSDEVLIELQRAADRSAQRQCPLEIVLVGQPALAARLSQPALAAVNNQVSLRFELQPLNAHHTRRYLLLLPAPADGSHPPQFSRKACRDIHTASRGVPRDIEALAAESARLAGRANATIVSPEHVRAAAHVLGNRAKPKPAAPAVAPKPAAADAKAVHAPKHVAPVVKAAAAAPAAAKPAAHAQAAPAQEPVTAKAKADAKKPEPAAEAAKSEAVVNGGSSVEATRPEPANGAVAATSSAESSPSGEFVPSDDPRVKDWVSRFGGSGVRLGGMYTGSVPDEPVESAQSFGATRSFTNDMNDTPPTASAGGSLDVRGEVAWPPPPGRGSRSRSRKAAKGPVLGKRDSGSNLLWPAVALVLAIALGAVLFAQRRLPSFSLGNVTQSAVLAPIEEKPAPAAIEQAPAPVDSAPLASATKPKREEKKQSATTTGSSDRLASAERTANVDRTASAERATRPASTAKKLDPSFVTVSDRFDPSLSVPRNSKKPQVEATRAAKAYTVLVGSFLKSDMAFAEREHLARLTNHPVWVSRRNIDGVRTYRIILGAFESNAIAEKSAQSLLQRGLIRDAKVLPLPLDP